MLNEKPPLKEKIAPLWTPFQLVRFLFFSAVCYGTLYALVYFVIRPMWNWIIG